MEAREYLMQAESLDKKINAELRELERLKALATRCTSALGGVPGGGSGRGRTEDVLIKIADMQTRINGDVDTLVDFRNEAEELLSLLPCSNSRTLLKLRYFDYLTWEEIAREMGYGGRYIYDLHRRALAEADRLLCRMAS